MGIKGLWKEVQPICRAGHISQFRGLRVGVDTYCWLHRAVIACATELAMDQPCDKYLAFMSSRVDLLLRYGVTPVLVFDGDAMPMKKETDNARKARRVQALEEGRKLMDQGAVEEARRMFEKSLDVTTEIAYTVIQVMLDRGIECIVAPYEADAQLGYLAKEGYIHAVVSEDSDLIVYHCGTLLAKMDAHGNCDCLHVRDLPNVPLLSQLSYESFVVACIMSGCDYLASLPNVGVKTAMKLVGSCKSIPLLMDALIHQHGFSQREVHPYEAALHKAFYCFAHHLVFDPLRKSVVPFRPFPLSVQHREELIGAKWDNALAESVCKACAVDPIHKVPYRRQHQRNTDMYWRKVKGGQTALTAYQGFNEKRSARIVVAMPTSAEGGHSFTSSALQRRLPDSPGMKVAGGAASTSLGFIGGRPIPSSSSVGANGVLQPQPVNRSLVVSKYFYRRSAVIDGSSDSDGSDGEAGCPPEGTAASSTVSPLPVQPAERATISGSEMDQKPVVQTQPAASPSPQTIAVESGAGSPLQSSPLELSSQPRGGAGAGCPYGYAQCGRGHSIFLKCFEGKGWTKGGDAHSPHVEQCPSTQALDALDRPKRLREATSSTGPSQHRSLRTSDLQSLRQVLGAPAPAAAAEEPSPQPLQPVPSVRRSMPSFTPPATTLMSSGEGVSASTRTAAALFDRLAFKR